MHLPTFSPVLLLTLTISTFALPNPASTSCINGKCVTGDSSTEASSINGVDSFKSDGKPGAGIPQAAAVPAAAGGGGAGVDQQSSSSSSSVTETEGGGSTAAGAPDVKKMLQELGRELGIDLGA